MPYILFFLWQCLWGLPQTLLGLCLLPFHCRKKPFFHRGCLVVEWKGKGSMSLGGFLFLSKKACQSPEFGSILAHEYGHSLQSMLLGPLYLFVIGIPSFVWANLPGFVRLRREKNIPYCRLYTETWANLWGKTQL